MCVRRTRCPHERKCSSTCSQGLVRVRRCSPNLPYSVRSCVGKYLKIFEILQCSDFHFVPRPTKIAVFRVSTVLNHFYRTKKKYELRKIYVQVILTLLIFHPVTGKNSRIFLFYLILLLPQTLQQDDYKKIVSTSILLFL